MNKSHDYLETEPEPSRHRLTWPSPAGVTPHGSNDSNVPSRGIEGSTGSFGMIQVVPEMVTFVTMGFDTFSTSVWFQCRLSNTVLSVVHHLFHGCKQSCGFNVGETLVMSVNWPPSNKAISNICSTGITYCLMSFKIDQNTTQMSGTSIFMSSTASLLCPYHSLPPKRLALESISQRRF